jgi:hypothetical protein
MAKRDTDRSRDSEPISSTDDDMVRGRADEMDDDAIEDTDEFDDTEDTDDDEEEGDGTF